MRRMVLICAALLLAGIAASALQIVIPATTSAGTADTIAFVAARHTAVNSHTPKAVLHGNKTKRHPNHKGTRQWHAIAAFAGTGSETTSPVHVARAWQLAWSCDPATDPSGMYVLKIWVNSSTSHATDQAVNVVCAAGATSGTAAVALHGSIDLQTVAPATDAWSLQVQVRGARGNAPMRRAV